MHASVCVCTRERPPRGVACARVPRVARSAERGMRSSPLTSHLGYDWSVHGCSKPPGSGAHCLPSRLLLPIGTVRNEIMIQEIVTQFCPRPSFLDHYIIPKIPPGDLFVKSFTKYPFVKSLVKSPLLNPFVKAPFHNPFVKTPLC